MNHRSQDPAPFSIASVYAYSMSCTSQAVPIHRNKTNIPITESRLVWSHCNLKATRGQAGARAGEKDRRVMPRHPAGYSLRGAPSFSACFLIPHQRNHRLFSRTGWCPGSVLSQHPSMLLGAAGMLDVLLLVWVTEVFHHLWPLKIPSHFFQGSVSPPDLSR